jgi:hypothetical protein
MAITTNSIIDTRITVHWGIEPHQRCLLDIIDAAKLAARENLSVTLPKMRPIENWKFPGAETQLTTKELDGLHRASVGDRRVSTRCPYYMCRISDAFRPEERGRFTPKYLRDLSSQAEKALNFVIILSRIEAGIEKVYNKITLV